MIQTAHWTWVGRTRRHRIDFEHNLLSGRQSLVLNGAAYFCTGWKFSLTGIIYLTVDDQTVELYCNAGSACSLLSRSSYPPFLPSLALAFRLAHVQERGSRAPQALPLVLTPSPPLPPQPASFILTLLQAAARSRTA